MAKRKRKSRRGRKSAACKTAKGKLRRGCEWKAGPNADWGVRGSPK